MQNNRIEISISKQFIILISILLSSTLMIICFLQCALLMKIMLIGIVLGYGFYILFHYGFLWGQHSIIAITRDGDDWILHEKDKSQAAKLCGSSTVTHTVCILRFIISGKRFKCVCIVFRDSFQRSLSYREFFLQVIS